MREIKFRAWDEYEKVMIFTFDGNYTFMNKDETGELFIGGFQSNGDWNEPKLMQYTGLKDKNGKEIYEGDVILWDRDTVLKVEFINGEYKGIQIDGPVPGDLHCYHFTHSEIIGNIHENPELL